MQTITVKIERPGTFNEYELSPDIEYIATCDDQPVSTIKIGFNQATFNQRKNNLRYFNVQEADRIDAISFFGNEMKKILDGVKMLGVEINRKVEPLHLRLIIEPRELVQLPFELTRNPEGVPGESMIAFLLNQTRLFTMTREVRQPGQVEYTWPVVPRILFASANPKAAVPHQQHFEALRDIVKELVGPDKSAAEPVADISQMLFVLPQASPRSIKEAVKEGISQNKPFTHIHILAHGGKDANSLAPDEFKLMLHDNEDAKQPCFVNGNELAMAILELDGDNINYPAVVSLMACDSANTNDLMLPSGSFAHQLHENGIPCVFASQFPLTIPGSIDLVKVLYEKLLLDGEDPRRALYEIRNELNKKKNHDWASLVAYTHFPANIDNQLKDYRLKVYLEFLKTSNSWSEHILTHRSSLPLEMQEPVLDKITNRLNNSINKLERLFAEWKGQTGNANRLAEHSGIMGSGYKRKAEHLFRLAVFYREKAAMLDADTAKQLNVEALQKEQASKDSLNTSRDWYRAGFKSGPSNHWTGMQYLSLTAMTKGTLEGKKEEEIAGVVKFMAEKDEDATADPMARMWAWGTLIEYYLLEPLTVPINELAAIKGTALAKAEEYAEKLAGAISGFSFDPRVQKKDIVFAQETTVRQIDRYIWWWPVMYKDSFMPELTEMAEQIKKVLKNG